MGPSTVRGSTRRGRNRQSETFVDEALSWGSSLMATRGRCIGSGAIVVLAWCLLACGWLLMEQRVADAQHPGFAGPAVRPAILYVAQVPGQPAQAAAVQGPMPQGASAEPVMRAYACPPAAVQAVAAALGGQYGPQTGVRIAPDVRTGQLLILAPPEVHPQIAQRIGQLVATAPAPGAAQEVRLVNTSGQDLEARLMKMLGNRLTGVASPSPEVARYQLALADGGQLRLAVDRRNHRVLIEGPASVVRSGVRLLQTLDHPPLPSGPHVGLVSLRTARRVNIRQAVEAIQVANAPGERASGYRSENRRGGSLLTTLFAQVGSEPAAASPQAGQEEGEAPAASAPAPGQAPPPGAEAPVPAEPVPGEGAGLLGPVQVEMLPGLDILIIRGRQSDVEQVMQIIEQIEKLSEVTEPAVRVLMLQHVNCQPLAEIVQQVYGEVYEPRQGSVTITPLVKPNALLVVGRPQNVETALQLARRLDKPVAPETQFQVFRLEHGAAEAVAEMINQFYEEREGLGTQVVATADFRSNSVVVSGSPRDLAEVAQMIARLDTPDSKAVNEIRLFQLQNIPAEDAANALMEAIQGAAPGAAAQQQAGQKSVTLRFLKVDAEGKKLLSSGILADVQITALTRSNALLVSAPAVSIPLIEALIYELDRLPAAEAQIKVFEIVNGDAQALADMLQELFGEPTAAGEMAVQTAPAEGESTLVPLRFSVDARTNAIIASGTAASLAVVEAILVRLDQPEIRKRQTRVFQLKNSPADAVATAVNDYLASERQVEQGAPGLVSPFELFEREVVVVPETVTNSLVVSATPRYMDEIVDLVEQLDARPPMVMIQVLIAEVSLKNTDEFGVELGLQDSILFDRSLLGDISTISRTTITQTPGGATTQIQEDIIASATNTPGFNFNNQPLGNSGSTDSLARANIVGTQGLANFALGRLNSELGYGGLVLAASSESVSMLLRALQECRRLEVLSRPQIVTLDNQPAFIQVGERVPRITNVQITQTGTTNNVTLDNVGLILGVRPRVSPDGLVVMDIDVENSKLGPEAEGIPIQITVTGDVIRSPRINTITAQTTVTALSGQTIVLGGLISKSTVRVNRRVPVLADIPILGDLFRYDLEQTEKKELLIVMTPHVVETEEDVEMIKQKEMARISWCLSDVLEISDDLGFRTRTDEWTDAETTVIYPEGLEGAEQVPAPEEPMETPEIRSPGEIVPFELETAPEEDKGPPEGGAAWSPTTHSGPVLSRWRQTSAER